MHNVGPSEPIVGLEDIFEEVDKGGQRTADRTDRALPANTDYYADLANKNVSTGIFSFWNESNKRIYISLLLLGVVVPAVGLFGYADWVIHGWYHRDEDDDQYQSSTRTGIVIVGLCVVSVGVTILGVCLLKLFIPFLLLLHCVYAYFLAPSWVTTSFTLEAKAATSSECKLCSQCRTITEDPLISGSPWMFTRSHRMFPHLSFNDFEISSELCHLCSLLLHSVPLHQRAKQTFPANSAGNPSSKTAVQSNLHVKVWKDTFLTKKSEIRLQLCGKSLSNAPPLNIEWLQKHGDVADHNCTIDQTTDGPDVVSWAGEMIDKCIETHSHCESQFVKHEERSYLPKRLIDLKDYNTGVVKIVTTALLPAIDLPIQYLALSHCWGGASSTMLKQNNLEEASFKKENLPKNFSDAAEISCKLNVRFLWIDSLCIVQDDPTEWATESISMGLVYANAHCVISATASDNSFGGCSRPRDLFRNHCVIRKKKQSQSKLSVLWNHRLMNAFEEKVECAPISLRGWTFQERYLARRTLHFCSGCVIFECNQLLASDNDTNEISQHYKIRRGFQIDGTTHISADLEHVARKVVKSLADQSARLGLRGTFDVLWRYAGTTLTERIGFHNCWFELIEKYSKRALTKHQDKLMAISGMASFIQNNSGLTYSSGLWEEILPYNLLWSLSGDPKERPDRPVPSWSWASVDSTVGSRLRETGSTERNQFQHGWAILTSYIEEPTQVIKLDIVNNMVFNSKIIMNCNLWDFRPDGLNVIWDITSPPLNDLLSLPVLSLSNPHVHPHDSKVQLHGLILHPKGGTTYERVGYFWTRTKDAIDRLSSGTSKEYDNCTIVLE
ncbi:HET-domain-containing protein [Microthyrium microscopicum]|uniref:HET-domain-containing protein n=1 Tax=Microthyrium microscopicum TaxID=703497 RepID=A0A6A6UDN3_9PEZI|nr:HET-domain-containing protein [Microthyrium microscopicum]